MSYPFSDLESLKLFLLLISDKSLSGNKTSNSSEMAPRRFRETSNSKKVETKVTGKLDESSTVSKLEGLLKKAGFEVV